MDVFRSAAEVIRLTIENAIHQKAFQIAQCANDEQENLLRQLLTITFQVAKEGSHLNEFLRVFLVVSFLRVWF